ncbi:MAG: zinc-binding dehydrogenase [Actinomycetota bacterium]
MGSIGVVNYSSTPHSVELREVDRPVAGDDDVIMQVEAVSVCGSDLHQWSGSQSWPVNYPVVLGHEFGGHIVELGKNVKSWAQGDRVVSETAAEVDMSSPMSRSGRYNLDPNRKGFGYGVNGGMTRFVKVPARCLHRIPESVSFEHAAMTEPCAVAYSAVIAPGNIRPGDRIIVLGPGPIGILCAAMARLAGAEVAVVGLERDRARLQAGLAYGCEIIIGDATEWALAVDGLGADGVVDAAGVSATLKMALSLVRPAGWIAKVGWGPQPLDFSLDPLVQKNVTLQGSFSHNWPMWERVLRMLGTGRLDIAPVLGGVWPIQEWQSAFEKMHSGEILKSVLKPE